MHYLRYSKGYAESFARGTTFLELSAARIKALAVPIPPPDQQEAIAIALEQILGRIQSVRELLSPVPGMVTASVERVLADAYDGNLTEKWRSSNKAAPRSLLRVADLLAMPIQNGLSVKGRDIPPGVRALRLSSLRSRVVDLEDVRFLPIAETRAKRFWLEDGDVLVSRGSGTRSLVGRTALTVGLDQPTIYPDTAFRLRVNKELVLPEWLSYNLNAPQVRNTVSASSRTTAGIWKIRQSDIAELPLVVPCLDEQREIVKNVDNALSRLESLQWSLASASEMLDRLETTTLSLAFRGGFAMDAMKAIELKLSELRHQALEAEVPPNLDKVGEGPVKMSRALKSRLDFDVKGKPFLANLLAEQEAGISGKSLFELSTLSIVDFYKQLAWEVDNGHIEDRADGFRNGQ
jgi:type I restriction enzyme S subunit